MNPKLIAEVKKGILFAMETFRDMDTEERKKPDALDKVMAALKANDMTIGKDNIMRARKLIVLGYEPKDYSAGELEEISGKSDFRINQTTPPKVSKKLRPFTQSEKAANVKNGDSKRTRANRGLLRLKFPDVRISAGPLPTKMLTMLKTLKMEAVNADVLSASAYQENGHWFARIERKTIDIIPLN